MTNYIRQRLSWQFPECAKSDGEALMPFLADSPELAPRNGYSYDKNRYKKSVCYP